ncbi:hypothetical protein K502DRAFT_324031 [Neoconidiobolus thromboides FSU 785]|nr:hypothetical protein K502DRAFT_324031 [Neoconidiobolus thromboides FSU 785]
MLNFAIVLVQLLYVAGNNECFSHNDKVYSINKDGIDSYEINSNGPWNQVKSIDNIQSFALNNNNNQLLFITDKLNSMDLSNYDVKELSSVPTNNLMLSMDEADSILYAKSSSNSTLYDYKLKTKEFNVLNENKDTSTGGFQYYNNQLVMLGGIEQTLNEIQIYDITSKQWKNQKIQGDLPSSRKNYDLQVIDDKLYLIGGRNSNNQMITNKLWVLDLKEYTWSSISLNSINQLFNNNEIKCQLIVNNEFYTISNNNQAIKLNLQQNSNRSYITNDSIIILSNNTNNGKPETDKTNYYTNKILIALAIALGMNCCTVVTFFLYIELTKKLEKMLLSFKNKNSNVDNASTIESIRSSSKPSFEWKESKNSNTFKLAMN